MDAALKLLSLSGQNVLGNKMIFTVLQALIMYTLGILGVINPMLIKNPGLSDWAAAFDSFVLLYGWSVKMSTYKICKKTIRKLVVSQNQFWKADSVDTKLGKQINRNMKIASRIFYVYVCMNISLFIVTLSVPLRHHQLPNALYQFIDLYQFPFYQIVYLAYFIRSYIIVTFMNPFDGLCWFLGLHFCAQFTLLKKYLMTTVINTKEEDREFVNKFLEHHTFLLNLVEDFKKAYCNFILFQIVNNLVGTCIPIYLFFTLHVSGYWQGARYIIYAVTSSCQIFFFCLVGSLLQISKEDVANAIYQTDWYSKGKTRLQGVVSFVMMRAQQEADIKAGGVFVVELPLFVAVMKLSFSFFTLMKKAEEKNGELK